MKKIISVIFAAIIAAALAVPAFAASSFDASTAQHDKTITGNSPNQSAIPVYGYVGQNAVISDTAPGNAATPPTATPNGTSINVTVPTKVIFAAFAEDKGAVTSPAYSVSNNSNTNSIDVTLVSFAAKSSVDNTAVDSSLSLTVSSASKNISVLNNGTAMSSPVEIAEVSCQDSADFSFGGNYTGSFSADHMPQYEMVFKFTLA